MTDWGYERWMTDEARRSLDRVGAADAALAAALRADLEHALRGEDGLALRRAAWAAIDAGQRLPADDDLPF